ncbi:MAG: hypothetical protein OCD76_05040 [Reichenbachiella sp.]
MIGKGDTLTRSILSIFSIVCLLALASANAQTTPFEAAWDSLGIPNALEATPPLKNIETITIRFLDDCIAPQAALKKANPLLCKSLTDSLYIHIDSYLVESQLNPQELPQNEKLIQSAFSLQSQAKKLVEWSRDTTLGLSSFDRNMARLASKKIAKSLLLIQHYFVFSFPDNALYTLRSQSVQKALNAQQQTLATIFTGKKDPLYTLKDQTIEVKKRFTANEAYIQKTMKGKSNSSSTKTTHDLIERDPWMWLRVSSGIANVKHTAMTIKYNSSEIDHDATHLEYDIRGGASFSFMPQLFFYTTIAFATFDISNDSVTYVEVRPTDTYVIKDPIYPGGRLGLGTLYTFNAIPIHIGAEFGAQIGPFANGGANATIDDGDWYAIEMTSEQEEEFKPVFNYYVKGLLGFDYRIHDKFSIGLEGDVVYGQFSENNIFYQHQSPFPYVTIESTYTILQMGGGIRVTWHGEK